jgi:L-threonate 2-dehydrogenase
MRPVAAIIAPGAMGAAVGRRLAEHGMEVCTSLVGRGQASTERAISAGMLAVEDAQLADADFVLSIVPPAEALAVAERLAPILARTDRKPVYADCNAVSPQAVARIGAVVSASGAGFVDAGIIGGPPKPGAASPVFYLAGADASRLAVLGEYGLAIKIVGDTIGTASALKMSYAAITKGVTALACASALAADRFGVACELRKELAASQPELLARFDRSLPDMYPKAYRWVAEMQEIADFAGGDAATRQIYLGIAELYRRVAADQAGAQQELGVLNAFLDAR